MISSGKFFWIFFAVFAATFASSLAESPDFLALNDEFAAADANKTLLEKTRDFVLTSFYAFLKDVTRFLESSEFLRVTVLPFVRAIQTATTNTYDSVAGFVNGGLNSVTSVLRGGLNWIQNNVMNVNSDIVGFIQNLTKRLDGIKIPTSKATA